MSNAQNKAGMMLDPSYVEWAPTRNASGKGWIAHKSAPSAPPAPDYAGAAQQTAAGNLENLKYQTQANRPNQVTPWGTVNWTQNGDNNWTQTTALSPQAQQALDSQMNIQKNQSSLANTLQGQVASTMAAGPNTPQLTDYTNGVNKVNQNFTGFDSSGLTPVNTSAPTWDNSMAQKGADASYHGQMDLIQPQMQQDLTHLDTQLRLQGLTPGTEAYNNAMQNLQRTQAQMTTQAANQSVLAGNQMANQDYASALAGYQAGNQGQQQAYNQALASYGANTGAQEQSNQAAGQANQQALQNYQTAYASAMQNYLQPLNSMNAVLTGQQVQNPQMPSFTNAGYTPGADMTGAASATGQYNSGLAAQGAANASSLNGLLGTGAMAAATFFSDERLKMHIVYKGKTPKGHNWYSWTWRPESGMSGTSEGVIAQEIQETNPEAVIIAPNGYLAVDYSKLK